MDEIIVPEELKHLRACLRCGMLKNISQVSVKTCNLWINF